LLTYLGWMLVVPALPLADASEGVVAVGRLELWLVLVVSQQQMWLQWTSGFPATFSDRVPILTLAAIWMGLAWGMGRLLARADGSANCDSSLVGHGVSLAAGSAVIAQCVWWNGHTFGTQSWLGLVGWVAALGSVLWIAARSRPGQCSVQVQPGVPIAARGIASNIDGDPSWERLWSRRWIPLAWLACGTLGCVTLAGACIPSYDADVREVDMLATRMFFEQGTMEIPIRHAAMSQPSGEILPALGIASLMHAGATQNTGTSIAGLLLAVLAGQAIHASMWLVAIAMMAWGAARRESALAMTAIGLLLVSHPGMHELVRLGGGAGGAALWLAAAWSLWDRQAYPRMPWCCALAVAAGANGHSQLVGGLVGVPLLLGLIAESWQHRRDARGVRLQTMSIGCNLLFIAWISAGWLSWVWMLWPRDAGWALGSDGLGGLGGSTAAMFDGSSMADAARRMVWDSSAHGLLLVPLAVMGACARWDRRMRFASAWLAVWVVVWWLATEHRDKDWVIATPLLAVPAAAGIGWLQRSGGGWALAPSLFAAWAWAVVVLGGWPLSDPRWLTPLSELTPRSMSSMASSENVGTGGAGEGRGENPSAQAKHWGRSAPMYVDWIHTIASRHASPESVDPVWWLVGTSDTFFLEVPTLTNGWRDREWIEDLIDTMRASGDRGWDEADAARRWLQDRRVGYVVVDWQGWERSEQALGTRREGAVRDAIATLQSMGCIQRVDWEVPPEVAECYRVLGNSSRKADAARDKGSEGER